MATVGLVNSVLLGADTPPFLTNTLVDSEDRRLGVIGDVSCDPNNPGNPLPIYDRVTDFDQPVLRVRHDRPLDVIAVDHLPSLLPRESSEDFSTQLLPHLMHLAAGSDVWQRCEETFAHHLAKIQ